MLDTQQEWLEKQLDGFGRHVGHPSGWYIPDVVEIILSAWPSSPQGLAVKQMREAAEVALSAGFDGSGDYIASYEARVKPLLRAALDAARKAGVR